MQNNDIVMFSVKDIRDMFKCSLSQAYGIVNSNGFPSIRLGGKILIEKKALENWLEKNKGKKVFLN